MGKGGGGRESEIRAAGPSFKKDLNTKLNRGGQNRQTREELNGV
jgi:hypothetical protein